MKFDSSDVTIEALPLSDCEGETDGCTGTAEYYVSVELPGMGMCLAIGKYCAACADDTKERLTTDAGSEE